MMIKTELSNEEYHGDITSYSSSALKLYLKDPIEFHKQYILGEKPSIPAGLQAAFDFGSYVHTRILEPHLLKEEYVIYDGDSFAEKQKLAAEHPDKTVITVDQKSIADKMIKKYESKVVYPEGKKYKSFFQRGNAEESMFCELEGLPVKIRTDYRKERKHFASINDVKTTSKKITVENIKKTCEALDYDLSAALYVDVAEKVTGKPHDFFLLFLGKKDYECLMVRASNEFIERGRAKYLKAIKGIKKSLETGVWIAEI